MWSLLSYMTLVQGMVTVTDILKNYSFPFLKAVSVTDKYKQTINACCLLSQIDSLYTVSLSPLFNKGLINRGQYNIWIFFQWLMVSHIFGWNVTPQGDFWVSFFPISIRALTIYSWHLSTSRFSQYLYCVEVMSLHGTIETCSAGCADYNIYKSDITHCSSVIWLQSKRA